MSRSVLAVNRNEYETYGEDLVKELRALLAGRYGRTAKPSKDGYGLTLVGAGYALTGGWWSLQKALDAGGTTYHDVDWDVRLDALLADVLLHPDDAATDEWAARYGYASVGALARAFRARYGLPLGHVRRVATVGRWLALTARSPRSATGRARRDEAESRVAELRRHMRPRPKGPAASRALRTFTSPRHLPPSAARPRYPPLGLSEQIPTTEDLK